MYIPSQEQSTTLCPNQRQHQSQYHIRQLQHRNQSRLLPKLRKLNILPLLAKVAQPRLTQHLQADLDPHRAADPLLPTLRPLSARLPLPPLQNDRRFHEQLRRLPRLDQPRRHLLRHQNPRLQNLNHIIR